MFKYILSINILIPLFISSCINICDSSDPTCQGKITFVSDRAINNINQLFIMNADGTNQTRLTFDNNNYRYPIFSPDGTEIVFYSHTWDDSDEIYRIDINGDNLTNLTNSPGSDDQPTYSPDGSYIVFTSTRDGNREIYIMNSDGSSQTRLTNNGLVDHSPQFIFNGSKIMYFTFDPNNRNYNINIMDIDGNNNHCLTNDREYYFTSDFVSEEAFNVYDGQPCLSINKTDIIFSAFSEIDRSFQLYKINTEGIIDDNFEYKLGFYDLNPRFTPDGHSIVFRSHRGVNYDLYKIDINGNNLKNLTDGSGHAYFSQFANNGTKILFNTDRKMYYKIWIMDLDGKNQIQLTEGDYNDYYPNYTP